MKSINKIPAASRLNIEKDIDIIDRFNSTLGEGTTRILFTKEEIGARNYVKKRMEETGLQVVEDCVGNIHGILPGTQQKLAPVWTGSHIDTVNNAGKFDGMAGVVAGIEALRVIKESGQDHKRSIEVIVFTSEEPTRFGIWGIGSHAMAGKLPMEDLACLLDDEGKSLRETLLNLGYDLSTYPEIERKKGDVHAFVELHIEQAPILDRKKVPIGIVETICGLTAIQMKISGVQGHAGGTPKYERFDPVMAMSEICLYLESLIYRSGEPYLVGTVGKVVVNPNASNVIAKEVTFSVDIRDRNLHTKDKLVADLSAYAHDIAKARGLQIEINIITHDAPVQCSSMVTRAIGEAAASFNYDALPMVSGAFHDAVMVACFAPIGMIFVPCREGISHSPEEWSDFEDIRKGTDVLAASLYNLANGEEW